MCVRNVGHGGTKGWIKRFWDLWKREHRKLLTVSLVWMGWALVTIMFLSPPPQDKEYPEWKPTLSAHVPFDVFCVLCGRRKGKSKIFSKGRFFGFQTRNLGFQFSRNRFKEEFFERFCQRFKILEQIYVRTNFKERKNINCRNYKFIQYWFRLHNNRISRNIAEISTEILENNF